MQKFLILAFCVAAATAAATVKVNPLVTSGARVITPQGVVSPVTRCGGGATFVQLRVSGCDGVCSLQPGTKYDIECDMIPALASPSLTLKVSANIFGSDVSIVDTVLASSSVQPGQLYTVVFGLTPNDILSGRTLTLKSQVSHTDTGFLEICIQNEVKIN